jgi:hypothetical protein
VLIRLVILDGLSDLNAVDVRADEKANIGYEPDAIDEFKRGELL